MKEKPLLKARDSAVCVSGSDEADSTDGSTCQGPLEAAVAALKDGSSRAEARKALTRLDASLKEAPISAELLLTRGLLKWRLAKLEEAYLDLNDSGAAGRPALLAFLLCLSKFPDALALSDLLGEKDVHSLAEHWRSEAEKLSNLFFPCVREHSKGTKEIFEGVRQTDLLLDTPDGTTLGLRLLLRHEQGQPCVHRPLVLVFHGEDENIDTFCQEEHFEPWRQAAVNMIIADFRGYGFSSGTASHYHLSLDCIPDMVKTPYLPPSSPSTRTLYNPHNPFIRSFDHGSSGLSFFFRMPWLRAASAEKCWACEATGWGHDLRGAAAAPPWAPLAMARWLAHCDGLRCSFISLGQSAGRRPSGVGCASDVLPLCHSTKRGC